MTGQRTGNGECAGDGPAARRSGRRTRVVAIAFVVARTLRRRGDDPDGGYHRRGPAAVR